MILSGMRRLDARVKSSWSVSSPLREKVTSRISIWSTQGRYGFATPALESEWPHKVLILYPTGLVVSISPREEPRYESWEKTEFEKFLKQIPKPSCADRTRDFREDVKARIIFISIIVLFGVGFSYGIHKLLVALGFQ
jgi:hypothetical protein